MTKWQTIKHYLGFHGKDADNEWLDGRFFDGYAVRTYHCRQCHTIYNVCVSTDPYPSHNAELTRLRRNRDIERDRFRTMLSKYDSKD